MLSSNHILNCSGPDQNDFNRKQNNRDDSEEEEEIIPSTSVRVRRNFAEIMIWNTTDIKTIS
jgi:hypothetical protein